MNNKGITLIEMLIVLGIIAMLAVIAIPGYIGQQRGAARAEAYTNLQNMRMLEEQFFAENGRYTVSLGVVGNTTVIRDNNRIAMQAGELRAFRPNADSTYSYMVIQDVRLPNNPPVPFNPGAVIPQNLAGVPPDQPCYAAIATGIVGSRVDGDIFAIDCFNNKNF
ncbi:MAG: prepilin-type N-terminal cleavage/methylation domain-containing protein [Nitrospirae bacterium]|nr:prepilin-type N-terminal cleavage/methylation domain-containing protein [Nitrospirota bacterium]